MGKKMPSKKTQKLFRDAVAFVEKLPPKPPQSNATRLAFYSLYKQATIGPLASTGVAKPSLLSGFVKRAKWQAWNDLGRMTAKKAMKKYIAELAALSPEWRERVQRAKEAKLRSRL